MKAPIFTGSCTAIVTPFASDGKINKTKMAEIIDFQIAGGIKALVINGTTGENATQPLDEHTDLVDFCVGHINRRCKVIAGVGSNDTSTALHLATRAKASGADGILMVTPYYNKTTQKGLVKHFTYVADRVDIPMILYNVPGRTTMSISADTYKILADHPNINGTKEASADFSLIGTVRAAVGDKLNVWSGNDDNTVPMMALGAIGVISVASNIIPDVITNICNLALEGNFKAAAQLQLKYMDLFNKLFIEVNPMPVKAAMNLMGMAVGEPRLPLCEMGSENLEKLRRSMVDVGLKLV